MSLGKRYCCFGTCKSFQKEGKPGYDPSVKFYRFPQPCLLLRNNILTWTKTEESLHVNKCEKCKIVQRWMVRCKRSDDRFQRVRQISSNIFICSKHFEGNLGKLDYSSCLPMSNSNLVNKTRGRTRINPTQVTVCGNQEASDVSQGTMNGSLEEHQRELPTIIIEDEPIVEPRCNGDMVTPSTSNYLSSELDEGKKSVGTQTTTCLPSTENLMAIIERLNNQITDLKRKLSEAENAKVDAQKAQATSQLPLIMFEQQLKTNDEMCTFYTGFKVDQLQAVISFAAVDKIHYWGNTLINEPGRLECSSKPQGRTRTYTQAQELEGGQGWVSPG
uniref:THAP-type domain-containing protein n=1 Tax=Lygus hesperus TaxID=30085 RepID=A0A146LZV7_LYGHE